MDLRIVRRLGKQTLTEQELVEGCKRGDDLARRQLYERYAGKLMAICMRYMGNREEAEDLLHDGYIKLYDSFDKFEWQGEGTLPAWMARVMANLALQRHIVKIKVHAIVMLTYLSTQKILSTLTLS